MRLYRNFIMAKVCIKPNYKEAGSDNDPGRPLVCSIPEEERDKDLTSQARMHTRFSSSMTLTLITGAYKLHDKHGTQGICGQADPTVL